MLVESSGEAPVVRLPILQDDRIVHGISTRRGGVSEGPFSSANHSLLVGDEPRSVQENCRRFAAALSFEPDRMVMSRQTHGNDVLVVAGRAERHQGEDERTPDGHRIHVTSRPLGPGSAPEHLPRIDIQMTDQPGWLLSLRFADCVPILIAGPRVPAVAVVHAGWRGTVGRAAETAVATLRQRFGLSPDELRAGIGPSIGPCCYEVGPEVAIQFAAIGNVVKGRPGGRPHLDLWRANRLILEEAGVPSEQIETLGACTRCHNDTFFSHRAEGFPAGRFSSAIGILA